jgi:HPt (histidine-containing phosphotransfer) domain-containing protein
MSTIFDYAGSLHRMGDDQDLFHEMAELLRADAPGLLDAVHSAHLQGDPPRLERASHTLKGLAANFGASRAVSAAAEVERLAKQRQSSGLPAAIGELDEALDELIAALAVKFPAGVHG